MRRTFRFIRCTLLAFTYISRKPICHERDSFRQQFVFSSIDSVSCPLEKELPFETADQYQFEKLRLLFGKGNEFTPAMCHVEYYFRRGINPSLLMPSWQFKSSKSHGWRDLSGTFISGWSGWVFWICLQASPSHYVFIIQYVISCKGNRFG